MYVRRILLRFSLCTGLAAIALHSAPSNGAASEPSIVIEGKGESQCAPHGRGNAYAPEILRDAAGLRMWYGGQGRDGHDRIHLATSVDGLRWEQRGVVLEDSSANHLNDPSVVEVKGVLFMYYTRAATGVSDEIAVATSQDGVRWTPRGTVLRPGAPGSWDSFAVGRPSVTFEQGKFRMWYDGRKDLPPGAPDPTAPKATSSQRHVGWATSPDGIRWEKQGSAPVFDYDAGGLHLLRVGSELIMLIEGRAGTSFTRSRDGIHWQPPEELAPRGAGARERFGHVTPFLLPDLDGRGATLFYGAAAAASWDENAICALRLSSRQWETLNSVPPPTLSP